MFNRFGRPGLLGLAARTAVVTGTANAMAGAAQNRQRQAQADFDRQQYEAAQQQAAAAVSASVPPPPPAAPAAPSTGGDALIAQLGRLGDLHASGVLSDDEFTAAKLKLLG